ncbi:hypothetical protein CAEBREN_31627 [Caenorhabditis brenneri]|uniref:DDHD domain-containing protein n=1 Tax=Caenorhabditis brenneri TaxID=135651 RepID=G0NSA0_CAEBE|nr:hypothetical protein CAEBREN_31627 [Caenorhabditis brenneri]
MAHQNSNAEVEVLLRQPSENDAIQDIAAGERLLSDREKVPNNADAQRNNTPLLRDVLKDGKVGIREPIEHDVEVAPASTDTFSIPTNAAAAAADKLPTQKCAQARWYYLEEGEWKKFIDYESMVLEVKNWKAKGDQLDPEAQSFHDEVLAHFKFPESLPRCNLEPNPNNIFSDENSLREWKPEPNVLKALYKVNLYNTKITAIYWSGDTKDIKKGIFFTRDGNPIDPDAAEKISRHLEKDDNYEYYVPQLQLYPKQFQGKSSIGEYQIVYHTTNEVTIQKPKKAPQNLTTYRKAKWSQPTKIEHLIFVVHGVGHYKKPNSIVQSVKKLINGVDRKKFFIPIHWRSSIEAHTCRRECSKEHLNIVINKILPDVRLYDCTETGVKIRQSVICTIKARYDQFKSNNPDFNGSIALFGHSLGSVICYDILTNFKNIQDTSDYKLHFQVDRLFTVGSPLQIFLEKREALHETEGTSPIKQFCQIHETRPFRIHNIYHPVDPVARRLDPLIDERYRKHLAIKIQRGRGFRLRSYMRQKFRSAMCMWIPPVYSGLSPQIDHEISGKKWRDAHSCYWYSNDLHTHISRVAFNNVVMTREESRTTETTSAETSLMGVEVNAQVMNNNVTVPNGNNEVGND